MRLPIFAALAASIVLTACGTRGASHLSSAPRPPAQAVGTQSAAGSVAPPGWGSPAPVSAQLFALRPRAGATATMYDTITLSTVPGNPFALAGYTAGFWPTFLPLRHAYPGAHTVSIAIAAGYHADCLDVEPGDAAPSQVVGWVRAEKHAGWPRPCVYSSWWEFRNEVNPALARGGIQQWQVWKWDADYTYRPHIDLGFDATQWTDRCLGRNLDCSLVLRSFLSIAHPALNPPAPKPQPKPAPVSQLLRTRTELRRDLTHRRCRVAPYHGRGKYHRICAAWLREGQAVNRELHRKGVR